MFRKILIYLIVISPLIYALAVGYPVKSRTTVGASLRTYEIYNELGYLQALRKQTKIKSQELIKSIDYDLESYSPWFRCVWLLGIVALLLSFLIL